MWTLLLARATDPPGTFIDRRQLDAGQIKVGRSAKTCDWVLPDEHGHISREHCTISALGLDLFVIDTSTNGVALNRPDGRIAPQLPVAIRANDRLLIGDFVITVATEAAGAGMALMPAPPPPLPASPSGLGQPDAWFDTPVDPVWGSAQRQAEVHEFLGNAMDDFLGFSPTPLAGPAQSAPPPEDFGFAGPLGNAFARPIMADPLPPPTDFGIPEDWAIAPPGGASASSADPFAPMPLPAGDPFAPAPLPPPESDVFAEAPFPAEPFTPAPLHGETDDPFALPAPDPGRASPAGLPPPAASAAPAAPAAPTAPASTSGPDWAAFYEGAGIGPDELQLSPDAMRRLGVMYRQVVLGLSDIIQDRAAFKDEFRVERTQLSIGRNNPLKHLAPLDAARILLGDPLPGFMPADEAVRTAFEDIKKHQLAMLAGVQHALSAVFDRLSPPEIEKLIAQAAGQKKGLPFRRGIDPWTVYQTIFEALRRDAVSNANGVMSVAFREGYEKFLKSGQ